MTEPLKARKVVLDNTGFDNLEVIGAREHNLRNISVDIPRNKLVVITGISGSGKSSLAFDTIYAEGQRRYMESFSAYARSFIGNMERPDVDKINGLSPVISIEQKTTSRNPRSTVGTVTEVYDFFRLLYARAGEAYSYLTGKKMERQSEDQILDHILSFFSGRKLTLLAPVVKGRKGHYRELFLRVRKGGFTKVRVDGLVEEIRPKMQVDRYKVHDIEIVIDRIIVQDKDRYRIGQSLKTALKEGNGTIMVLDEQEKVHHFSIYLMDPETGLSYDEPAPNIFSFNSPYGACETCHGMGSIEEITLASIIPDDSKSISRGGILPLGEYRDIWVFKKIEAILQKEKLSITTPIKDIPEHVMKSLLYGDNDLLAVDSKRHPGTDWYTRFDGIISFLEKQKERSTEKIRKWIGEFTEVRVCPGCNGARLKKEPLHYKIADKNIAEIAEMDISELNEWLSLLEEKMNNRQRQISAEVLKELRKRVGFLIDVGLHYLQLNRPLRTLSGGEAQRIRLATQIGSQLVGVLYILDEPSIGLHQRDNHKLIKALQDLRDLGNSVIVVEHDKDMMTASDFIIDIGPGAGRHGGNIVAKGDVLTFLQQDCLTADFLNGKRAIEVPVKR
ncbi:MAG: excinuclease ABC subunit UvrA, partial [Cyclobacteriaceae bacterium]|nr:excinuclease ABC subunit UvrA [Cyclobacteriaceae bacterium]